MNSENFNPGDSALDELTGPLHQAVFGLRRSTPSAESLARVIDRATRLPTAQPQRHRGRWLRYSLASAIAAALLIAATLWLALPHDTWAQVVEAVKLKPWIHGTIELPDGKMEEWLSLSREVAAACHGKWALFDDYKIKVRYEFRPDDGKQGTLYRESLSPFETKGMRSAQDSFIAIMRGDKKLDLSLPGTEIVSQERRTIVEGGKSWIEYDFITHLVSRDETGHIVLRVDPNTKLPVSMTIVGNTREPDRKQLVTFDYPAEDIGPVDIYSLGVSRTSKIVDRLPSPQLADIISEVHKGQEKFGPYFAVVVNTLGQNMKPWEAAWMGGQPIQLVWRNGKKYRIEQVIFTDGLPAPKPEENADMLVYFKERLKNALIIPQRVCDGEAVWVTKAEHGKIQKDQRTIKFSWEKFFDVRDSDNFNTWIGAVSLGIMPDVMAYGFPPQVSIDHETKIIENSPDDLPGCVLVEDRLVGNDPGGYHLSRYWYDTAHSYMLRKNEIGELQPRNGEPSDTDTYQTDTLAQTPSGMWYSARLRRTITGEGNPLPSPERPAFIWYYVDFNAKVPDSLFKPEARTGDIP